MHWTLDPTATVPVSEQIAEQVRFAIATGRLRPDDRLPSVRGLAREILVNPNTVAKVYRDLERDGVLRTRPGSGVFVAEGARASCRREVTATVRESFRAAVEKAFAAGLAPSEMEALLGDCLESQAETTHER